MKVSGFSFIRNAIKYDFPVVEAICSVLPVCDEFIVAVGKSDDDTLNLIKNIGSPKIRIIETIWDDSVIEGGKVLAFETDKAFQAISDESDWAFYIQGDEVVHEKYLDTIYHEMERWKDSPEVDGLLFKYKHFYGSYDYVAVSTKWYKNEIRVIRNNKNIYSYRDAQGFRKDDNKKLNVKPVDAYIYHYGWVKHPQSMQKKYESNLSLYFTNEWVQNHLEKKREFDYSGIDALSFFNENHPKVMEPRIKRKNWKFDYDLSTNHLSIKHRFKLFTAKYLRIHLGYKNYRII